MNLAPAGGKVTQWDLKRWAKYCVYLSWVLILVSKLLQRQRTVAKTQASIAVDGHEYDHHEEADE